MDRQAYAHDAVVTMRPGGNPDALGGAITAALCGHWDHPPPCPLAPHHARTFRTGETVTLRVLFATEPANERRVRFLIGEALGTGRLTGPDGRLTAWRAEFNAPGRVRLDEQEHAARLIRHGREDG